MIKQCVAQGPEQALGKPLAEPGQTRLNPSLLSSQIFTRASPNQYCTHCVLPENTNCAEHLASHSLLLCFYKVLILSPKTGQKSE